MKQFTSTHVQTLVRRTVILMVAIAFARLFWRLAFTDNPGISFLLDLVAVAGYVVLVVTPWFSEPENQKTPVKAGIFEYGAQPYKKPLFTYSQEVEQEQNQHANQETASEKEEEKSKAEEEEEFFRELRAPDVDACMAGTDFGWRWESGISHVCIFSIKKFNSYVASGKLVMNPDRTRVIAVETTDGKIFRNEPYYEAKKMELEQILHQVDAFFEAIDPQSEWEWLDSEKNTVKFKIPKRKITQWTTGTLKRAKDGCVTSLAVNKADGTTSNINAPKKKAAQSTKGTTEKASAAKTQTGRKNREVDRPCAVEGCVRNGSKSIIHGHQVPSDDFDGEFTETVELSPTVNEATLPIPETNANEVEETPSEEKKHPTTESAPSKEEKPAKKQKDKAEKKEVSDELLRGNAERIFLSLALEYNAEASAAEQDGLHAISVEWPEGIRNRHEAEIYADVVVNSEANFTSAEIDDDAHTITLYFP